jgi:hypothetical protein
MFFDCFSSLGLGPLIALEENLNSAAYIELLKEHLIPEKKPEKIPNDGYFHFLSRILDKLLK